MSARDHLNRTVLCNTVAGIAATYTHEMQCILSSMLILMHVHAHDRRSTTLDTNKRDTTSRQSFVTLPLVWCLGCWAKARPKHHGRLKLCMGPKADNPLVAWGPHDPMWNAEYRTRPVPHANVPHLCLIVSLSSSTTFGAGLEGARGRGISAIDKS
jgi:hypothetical protein